MMPGEAERERRLVYALRVLAEETSTAQPSAELEQRLLNELRHSRPMRPVRWGWVAAIAAALVLALLAPALITRPALTPQTDSAIAPLAQNDVDALTPWYFNEGLPEPEAGSVVRIEVLRAAADEYGAVLPESSSPYVNAELYVGDDGMARAIRFVR